MGSLAGIAADALATEVFAGSSSVRGDLRIHPFTSSVFGNTRYLRVLVPPGYDDPARRDRRYPVLYLNDGQNLFDSATGFGGMEWGVDETLDNLLRGGEIPPWIVVGIDHADAKRAEEYVPYAGAGLLTMTPRGHAYPRFLLEEVLPFIQACYRTRRGPRNAGLGGSSLGAAIALYTVLTHPGIFGRVLLESPSLFLGRRRLLRGARECTTWPHRVYLAAGTREAGEHTASARLVRNVRELEDVLRGHGLGRARLTVVIEEGAPHSETAWAARLPLALRFLLGT
ncbi:MAG: alpha/beta hydrolase [Gemmatimonadetes bacterium]|nr:alpha/beta hydrolase [Gemmatimonadota bacterium]